MTKVSVIVPFYGSFCVDRAKLALASIGMQEDIVLQILVSEEGEQPRLESHLPDCAQYIFTRRLADPTQPFFNPGEVRNRAASLADGDFIYTTDADIVFQHPQYLRACVDFLSKYSDVVIRRPRMRRLVESDVPAFVDTCENSGIKAALGALNRNTEYLATMDGRVIPLKVFSKVSLTDYYTKTFTATLERLEAFGTSEHDGAWPQIWWETLHCGGNFFRREHFDSVGWYCEYFLNWGCEDSDLQWKFEEKFRLRFFPYTQDFEVLHMDHPKPYFSKERWDQNEEIHAARRCQGIDVTIERDKAMIAKKYERARCGSQ